MAPAAGTAGIEQPVVSEALKVIASTSKHPKQKTTDEDHPSRVHLACQEGLLTFFIPPESRANTRI
jgi:uncharacterized 2Fe-2S/4Fe-4S cluster protein (DUF4445 family)